MPGLLETLKSFVGVTNSHYDFIFIVFSLLIIIFVFYYLLGLFAFLFKAIGGIK